MAIVPARLFIVDADGHKQRVGIVAGGKLPPIPPCSYWYVEACCDCIGGAALAVLAEWMSEQRVEGLALMASQGNNEFIQNEDLTPLTRVTSLKTLVLPLFGRVTPDGLKIVGQIKSLERLKLPQWSRLKATRAQLDELKNLPNLKSLDMSGVAVEGVESLAVLRELRSLRELSFGLYGAGAAVAALPETGMLESLRISTQIESQQFLDELVKQRHLRRLELSASEKKKMDWTRFAELSELESLEIQPDIPLEILSKLPKLRKLKLGRCEHQVTGGKELFALKDCKTLEELDVNNWPVTRDFLDELAALPRLRKLVLKDNYNLKPEAYEALAESKSLEELVPSEAVDAALVAIGKIKGLKALDLSYKEGSKDKGLAALSELRGMKRLNVRRCDGFGNAGFAKLAGLTELEELDIDDTKIDKAGLETLRNFKKLRVLRTGADVDSEVLGLLAGLPDLDYEKSFLHHEEITPADADVLSRLTTQPTTWLKGEWGAEPCALLARNKNIHALNLTATTDGIARLAELHSLNELGISVDHDKELKPLEKMPHLATLTVGSRKIEKPYELSAAGGASITAHQNLIELRLDRLRLSDEAAERIASLPLLTKLVLNSATLSDRALAFLAKLPELRRMEMNGCRGLSDAGLAALGGGTKICELWCRGQLDEKWTGAGLQAWPESSPLDVLYLSGCAHVTDEAARGVVRFKKMKRLDLDETLITDKALPLLEEMRELENVHIWDCKRLTYAAVKAFRERMEKRAPRCSVLENVRQPKTAAQMVTKRKEARLKPGYQKLLDAKTITAGELSPQCVKELERLGAKALPKEQWRKLPFEREIAPALLQLLCGYEWPKDARFSADEEKLFGAQDIDFSGRLSTPEELDQYLCLEARPFVGWGLGMNYLIITPLDTDMPEDPALYVLEEEDFDEENAKDLAPLRLSAFLKLLQRDK